MFEWEETLFLGVKSAYNRIFVDPRKRKEKREGAHLEDLRGELLWLGRMISGRPLSIFETDVCALHCGLKVFMPPLVSIGSSVAQNESLIKLKLVVASLSIRDMGNGVDVVSLAQLVENEYENLPRLQSLVREAEDLFDEIEGQKFWSWIGQTLPDTEENELENDLRNPSDSDLEKWGENVTEIEGKGRIGVEEIEELGDVVEEDMPIHTFEKAETLEEYSGLNRKADSDDELEDHKEALDKLEMNSVLRSYERPGSIYRSDVMLDSGDWLTLSDGPGEGIPYPEWNYKTRRYREDWCRVLQSKFVSRDPGWIEETEARTRKTTQRLKRHLAKLVNERMQIRRQPNGDDWDLDAVVDALVQLKTGSTPSDRLYTDRKRCLPDVALLLLLDYSYSTDSYIENRRTLDVIRDSVFSIGEAIDGYVDTFSIAGFSSNTRRACSFREIKAFNQPWRHARNALSGMRPHGYTRIGPAIRHGVSLLEREKASRKAIVLLTDGRPCDYDRYEGTYGLKDVRKCVEEAKLEGISLHSFAIEKRASETFPMMFPNGHYHALRNPDHLPDSMMSVFERILLD